VVVACVDDPFVFLSMNKLDEFKSGYLRDLNRTASNYPLFY
jgi:hypothetical protein